ncbi:MAG: pseudaminic acid cytidylyltransferase [Selenomonadaceae bacterium]
MSAIAIITARGGSKRIPRKNIKHFCGKPIIAYSIEAALNSKIFDEVMVSTDDVEIAKIAQEYGAKVPFYRSEKNSDDYADTEDVIEEVVFEYIKRGKLFEHICCIYPTAPLLKYSTLCMAYDLLQKETVSAIVPVIKFSYPPQRSLLIKENKLSFKHPLIQNQRSQDFEPLYHDAGQFYFIFRSAFLKEKTLFPANTMPLILKESEVQDIDNIEDWLLAEAKFQMKIKD